MTKFVTDSNLEALLPKILEYIDIVTDKYIVLSDGLPLLLSDHQKVYPKLD